MTLLHIALAVCALAVPLACAYLVVCRIARRNSRHHGRGTGSGDIHSPNR